METHTIKLLLTFFTFLLSTIHGIYDGRMYSLANPNKLEDLKHNGEIHPHTIAMTYRVILAFMMLVFLGIPFGIKFIGYGISMALMFSFWHNGAYFTTRGMIDAPRYNFFSKISTTTGFKLFELGIWQRSIMFVAGIILMYYI